MVSQVPIYFSAWIQIKLIAALQTEGRPIKIRERTRTRELSGFPRFRENSTSTSRSYIAVRWMVGASNFDLAGAVSTAGYLIVNYGGAHASARTENSCPIFFSLAFLLASRSYLRRGTRTTHARYFVPWMCQGGADYDGLIIDDDKNLTRKMFRGENSENTRATYGHAPRL